MDKRAGDAYAPFSPDPSTSYRAMREASCPVHLYQDEEHRFYALPRHADVRRVLAGRSLFSIKHGQMHTYLPGQGLTVDPPAHTILRNLLNPVFKPERVALLADRIEQIAEGLVGAIAPLGEADFYEDFASAYPVHVAAEILGVDPQRKQDFRRWVFEFTAGLNSGNQAMENGAREAVYAYFGDLIASRRAQIARGEECPDDLITVMAKGRHPDGHPLNDDELLPTTILLLAGGVDTTSFLLTSCVYRLLENRSLWQRVCAQPDLIPVAIEESLRFDSPVFGTFRTNEEPIEMHGVEIPRDSKIQMLFASANRDPAVFDDPDVFSLDRDLLALRRDHLAFGGGVHACIGSSLARLSARIAIATLVRLLPSLDLAGPPRRYKSVPGAIAVNNGFVSLPVRWSPGEAA